MRPEDFLEREDVPEDVRRWLREESDVRRQFDALMAHVPDTIYFKDAEGRFTRINDAQVRVLGVRSIEEAVGHTDIDYFGEGQGGRCLADDLGVIRSGQPILDKEELIPFADGTQGWMSTTKVPLRDLGGAVIGLVGISRPISRRKRAEHALRLTQFSLDHASVAVLWLDRDGTIRYANLAAGALLGAEPGDVVGRSIRDYDLDLTEGEWQRRWERLREARTVASERRFAPASGRPLLVEVSSSYLEFEGEQYAVVFVRDLTAVKGREDDLRLRSAADRVRAAAYGLDSHRDLHAVVHAFERSIEELGIPCDYSSFVLTDGEAAGRYIGVVPEDGPHGIPIPSLGQAVVEALRTQQPVYRPDLLADDPYDERGVLYDLREPGARSVVDLPFSRGTIGVACARPNAYSERDIDRLAELARAVDDAYRHVADLRHIHESEERYRTVFEAAHDGMFLLTEQATIADCNEAAVSLTGYARAQLIGMGVGEYGVGIEAADASGQDTVRDRLERALRGESVSGPLTIVRSDGGRRRVEVRLGRVEVAGKPVLLAVLHDVTERLEAEVERERLERRVQQAQRLESLSALAGGVAHDFNNILMGVLGNATLALQLLPHGSPVGPLIERIELAGARACELSRQMLAYSGRGRLLVEQVDLATLVAGAVEECRARLPEGSRLAVETAPALPPAHGDASQLRQVVRELLTNACEALPPEGGSIAVSVSLEELGPRDALAGYPFESLAPGSHLRIRVSDTGCGMDRGTLERIFEPFFSTKFAGRGLGLAASLGIVRGHHGGIRVQSESGVGTQVSIYLPPQTPLSPAASESAVPRAPSAPLSASGGTVLVVDDEEFIRDLAGEVLVLAGYTPLFACDGEEAISLFASRADELSAVLLDVTMPRMTGPEVLERIRAVRDDVPVILSSGYHQEDATRELSAGSFTGFLQKPYRPNELLDALQQVLHRRAPAADA